MKKLIWKIKYLFYKYILRHQHMIGVDVGSSDGDCYVITRCDRKGNKFCEVWHYNPIP